MRVTIRLQSKFGAAALMLLAACGGSGSKPHPSMPAVSAPDAGTQPMPDAGIFIMHTDHGPVQSVMQTDAGAPEITGFGVEPPRGPRSTARIRVLVVDPDLRPISGAMVSAGGPVIMTGTQGYAVLDEVYGKDTADVLVRAESFTEGRARVPIRDAELSVVVIAIAELNGFASIDDLTAAATIDPTEGWRDAGMPDAGADAGPPRPLPIKLALQAGALATPWGSSAQGAGTLQYALLDDPPQAITAPNGTIARGADGALVRLVLSALFELRVVQGATWFRLTKPASIDVPLGTPGLGGAAAGSPADTLYWFDPQKGAFVARDPSPSRTAWRTARSIASGSGRSADRRRTPAARTVACWPRTRRRCRSPCCVRPQ